MGRVQTGIVLFGFLFAIPAGGTATGGVSSPDGHRGIQDPAELVEQLGDASFAVRNRAMSSLVQLGIKALDALEQGVQSQDREISFRSRHALKLVRENDFQRRLQAFAAGHDAHENYQLPGWARFYKEVGGSPEARALFVEMQQAEPVLLARVERSPDEISEALVERVVELQEFAQDGRQPNQISLGTIATILFLLNDEHVELPMMVSQSIGSYFRYPTFASAIQAGSQRELLRTMLGTWIERSKGWDAYHAIYLAMQYDLPKGLVPAKKVLVGEVNEQNQSYFVCYAMLAYAKFGGASDVELIEPLLDDSTPYGGSVAVAGAAKYRTEIRDIALATLVHLTKQNPKDFGFDRLRSSSTQIFNTGSLAFENNEKREEAIRKWRAFRGKTPSEPPHQAPQDASDPVQSETSIE